MNSLLRTRKEQKLTQTQLAELLGLRQGSISDYEIGKYNPPLKTIVKIAELLNCTVEELAGIPPRQELSKNPPRMGRKESGFMSSLIRIRKERKLTQKELAASLGISQSNVSAFERGRLNPSLKTAIKIAEILNCTLDELVK